MKRLFNILLVFLPVMTALAYTPAVMTMDVNSVDYWGRFQISTRDYRSIGIGVGKHVVCQFSGGYLDVDACIEHRYGILEMVYVPSFHYYVTDNRGNVRLVVDGNGTVEQRNDYYAYGGQWGDNAINQGFQPFKYSGKELDRVHGLDWYDSQARMYDPVLARWHTQDSKAEDYYNWSPYVYCVGNPVNALDPDGCSVWTKLAKASVKIGKQVAKHGTKALTEGATYAQAVADITDDINTLTDSEASTGSKVWAGISLASELLPISINDVKDVGKIINRSKSYEKLHKKARIGQEAHRQIEKDLFDAGASIEIIVPLSSGKRIRKDAKLPNGDYIIIKPDTPSGHRRAKNREKLMEKEGYNTKTIYYDPLDPKYLPESPSYIGPK